MCMLFKEWALIREVTSYSLKNRKGNLLEKEKKKTYYPRMQHPQRASKPRLTEIKP